MTMTHDFGGTRTRISAFAAARHFVSTGLVRPLRLRIERRRAMQALSDLDDRLLRDVGVSRGDIPEVVAQEPRSTGGLGAAWRDALALYRLARVRHHMIRDLEALPDWILNDIGVPRWEIETAVDRSLGQQIGAVGKAGGQRTGGLGTSLRDVAARLHASAPHFPGGMAGPSHP